MVIADYARKNIIVFMEMLRIKLVRLGLFDEVRPSKINENILQNYRRIYRKEFYSRDDRNAYYLWQIGLAIIFLIITLIPSRDVKIHQNVNLLFIVYYTIILTTVYYICKANWKIGGTLLAWFIVANLEVEGYFLGMKKQNAGWDPLGAIHSVFIHKDWFHLFGNTTGLLFPLFVLAQITKIKTSDMFIIMGISWLFDCTAVALFGVQGWNYFGSSGVVFGVIAGGWWLCVRSINKYWPFFIPMTIIVGYTIPQCISVCVTSEISWLGHAGGFIGGLLAAEYIARFKRLEQ